MSKQHNHGRSGALVESLEPRTLLSAASVRGEALRVVGDAHAVNSIFVVESADGSAVDVYIDSVNRRGVVESFYASFAKSLGFTELVIRGGNLHDTIRVDQTAGPFTLPTRIDGRGDNDEIFAGDGDDLIVGGGGYDYIEAGGGDDAVYGGDDNDTLLGQAGDDVLWGGAADDYLEGGDGNDRLGGVLGTDYLIGGPGSDTFVVGSTAAVDGSDYDPEADVLELAQAEDDVNRV